MRKLKQPRAQLNTTMTLTPDEREVVLRVLDERRQTLAGRCRDLILADVGLGPRVVKVTEDNDTSSDVASAILLGAGEGE